MQQAFVDIRVLPWRPRRRTMRAADLREAALSGDPLLGADDPGGIVLGLGIWLVVVVAAPLVVLVLAVLLLSVELPVVVALALLLAVLRFAGVVPWTVGIVDTLGTERRESYRNVVRAVRRVREVNGRPEVRVRWAWA